MQNHTLAETMRIWFSLLQCTSTNRDEDYKFLATLYKAEAERETDPEKRQDLLEAALLFQTHLSTTISIITGGTSGIGQSTAYACWERSSVIISAGGRDNPNNVAGWRGLIVAEEQSRCYDPWIRFPPGGLMWSWEDMNVAVEKHWKKFGQKLTKWIEPNERPKLNIFLNAGTEGTHKSVEEIDRSDFTEAAVNFRGVIWTLKYLLPIMRKHEQFGTFILCSSRAALTGRPAHPLYAATKAAAENILRTEAQRWATEPAHPGFIIIRPEWVKSALTDRVLELPIHIPVKERQDPFRIGSAVAELFAGVRDISHIDVDMDVEVLLEPSNL